MYPANNSPENGAAIVEALRELGFELTEVQANEIRATFADAWQRHVDVEGFPVCHPADIIASKVAANRVKDREALPRLRAFLEYWSKRA